MVLFYFWHSSCVDVQSGLLNNHHVSIGKNELIAVSQGIFDRVRCE